MATKSAVKTYGKANREAAQSKAFDDALKPNSAANRSTSQTKWGKTSFSRLREDDPFEVTCKKVKIETESADPFSFDFEDGETVKKEVVQAPVLPPPPTSNSGSGLGRPAIPNLKVSHKGQEQIVDNSENIEERTEEEEDEIPLSNFSRRPVRTYSRRKKGGDDDQESGDQSVAVTKEENKVQGRPQRRDVFSDSPEREIEDPFADQNSKKKTTRTYTRRKEGNVPRMITSKTHVLHSEEDSEEGLTVLNFRSHYMDPAVYSQFKYTPNNDDPVGRLNNSKVLQKSEIKHGKGSTVIVVCSPKVPPVPGLKSYLKEKPRGPKASQEDPVSSFNQVSNLAEAAILAKQEIQTLNKNTNSAFDLTEENSDNFTSADPVPPRSFSRKTKSSSGSGGSAVRVNRIFKSKNRNLPEEEIKREDSPVKEETPPPPLQNEVIAEIENIQQNPAENSFGFDDGEESEMPDIVGQQAESMEVSQEPTPIQSSQESQETCDSPMEDLSSSQDIMSSSQGSLDSSQDSAKSKEPVKVKKIFRSKNARVAELQKKPTLQKSPSKAVYNVRSTWQADIDEEERVTTQKNKKREAEGPPKLTPAPPSKTAKKPTSSREGSPAEMPHLVRAVHWGNRDGDDAYTSVHVHKEHKELYTVVKNVKEAHEVQEHGETQEFADDIEYLLAGLKEGEPMSTRCLSCIGLAQKCISASFRMHLRAHGTVTVIFGSLQDAGSDPSLALCTALMMFMLSRDRLNMDLDKSSLNLMLRLMEVDNQNNDGGMTAAGKRALNRNIERAKEVYFQLQKEEGKENQTDLESVSTGNLAMESLLSLTSRGAGEWFKEELRTLGALDHIVDTVCSCIQAIGDDTTLLYDSTLENIKKTDRCLRVLENVIFVNTENQTYLMSYKSGIIGSSCCRALEICQKFLPIYPLPDGPKLDKESYGYVVYKSILAILSVLLNLTHENEFACTKVGEQEDFISTVLTAILQTPQYVPQDLRYDILILSLGLLINLVEHCGVNRRKVLDSKTHRSFEFDCLGNKNTVPAAKALVEVFCKRFETAKTMDEQDFSQESTTPQQSPNKSGEWKESESGVEWIVNSAKKNKSDQKANGDVEERLKPGSKEEDLADEETFAKALQKAGKHMENSIVASYIALLLGCVIQDNTVFVNQVKEHLPSGNFDDMIMILKKFLSFMSLTTAVGSSGGKSIGHVIEVLESC